MKSFGREERHMSDTRKSQQLMRDAFRVKVDTENKTEALHPYSFGATGPSVLGHQKKANRTPVFHLAQKEMKEREESFGNNRGCYMVQRCED